MLLSSPAYSGGSYFSVEVIDFNRNKSSFTLTAKVKGDFDYDSSDCKVIKLAGDYDEERWKNYSKLITKDRHLNALNFLSEVYLEKRSINLGYIGSGFLKVDHCSYKSKGLYHGQNTVMSIYGRI